MSNQHYIFTPHKNSNPQLRNWDKTNEIGPEAIVQIKDTVAKRSGAKAATSVPSPFARMHLFDTAFEICATSTKENPRPMEGESMYHRLVSDCLDVFQLLFNSAGQGDLSFGVWSKANEIATLRDKSRPNGHQLLGETLEMFMGKPRFQPLTEIVFIYYKNKLLGGTSPMTVFFTSPNWVREMRSQGWTLSSTTEDNYFDESIAMLHQRDPEFQRFMLRLYEKNRDLFHSQFETMGKYMDFFKRNYADGMSGNTDSFESDYEPLMIGQNQGLTVCGLTMYRRKAENVMIAIERDSDFVLQPTVNYYKQYKDEKGAEVNIPTPLCLINGFNQAGMIYIKSPWNPETPVPSKLHEALHQRMLPGNNHINYPYLVVSDFLADSLVELPFDLNDEHFFTGFNGRFPYLLPLKKAYFNFFTLNDLKRQLTISKQTNAGVDKIVVELRLPVKNGRFVTFHKEYNITKEQGKFKDESQITSARFSTGIFPFYQIVDKPAYNDYVLMLVDKDSRNVGLHFYLFEEVIHGRELSYQATQRVQKNLGVSRAGSAYYRLKGTKFDFIEVDIEGNVGLILPDWGQRAISLANGINTFTFGVDFGTSNTHVAYRTQNSGVQPLNILKEDVQVVMLNKRADDTSIPRSFDFGWGSFPDPRSYKFREFVPSIIGMVDAQVNFPIRTATCEGSGFRGGNKADLFANINIGFSIDSEEAIMDYAFYEINLKWGLENNKDSSMARERVKHFILQTLWMIKNKVILCNGRLDQTKISWFLPLSMSRQDARIFEDIWKESKEEVFGDIPVQLFQETESAAPYYFLRESQGLYHAQNAINIDIGGGTTDCLFLVQKDNRQISTSFRFAGNDIWGDGFSQVHNSNGGPKDSGFVEMMKLKMERNEIQISEATKAYYLACIQNHNFSSAEVISFMFKYNKEFNLSGIIQNHPLRAVLLLHFAAIVYHIGQLSEALGIEVPMYFIFTGNGAKYISILGENDMDDFAKLLLGKTVSKPIPAGFKLQIAPNPKEATANGGVTKLTSNSSLEINAQEHNHPGYELTAEEMPNWLQTKADLYHLLGDAPTYMQRVLDNYNRFLDIVFDEREVKNFLADLGIKLRPEHKEFLKEKGRFSFEEMSHRLSTKQGNDANIPESMFFWCLKDALYKYSKELR